MQQGYRPGDPRSERRELGTYPEPVIKFRPIGQEEYETARVVDHSTSGLGLLTAFHMEKGTIVQLNMNDTYLATGEVVDISDGHPEGWECEGMRRIGIRFLDKTNWPL